MLALLAPAVALAQPEEATMLAPDTEARWIDFQLTPYNQMRFPVEVNGRAAWAILDTGFTHSVVTSRFARTVGLKASRRQRALAIGGEVEIGWAEAGSIRFGGLSRSNGRIGIADFTGKVLADADMLVGADILGCCALDIDYDAGRFRILPSGRMPFTGAIAPLQRRSPNGAYHSELVIAGRTLKPVIVDTGDGGALTLTRTAWSSTGIRGLRVTTRQDWGAGGPIVAEMLVLPGFSLAGMAPVEAELRIEDEGGFSAAAGAAGRIGTSLLLRYRVLLDPRAGRMILQPGKPRPGQVRRSTSGVLAEFTGSALRVFHVMRGSPAEAAGWKAGELICSADGVAVTDDVRDGLVEWTAGAPGRTVRIGLCDGSERSLTLANFY